MRCAELTVDPAFDEWNVWYEARLQAELDRRGWVEAPTLIEDDVTAGRGPVRLPAVSGNVLRCGNRP